MTQTLQKNDLMTSVSLNPSTSYSNSECSEPLTWVSLPVSNIEEIKAGTRKGWVIVADTLSNYQRFKATAVRINN